VVNGAAQFGFGVVPDRRGHFKIAAMDQQFHQWAAASGALVAQR
jgi:hypothetical protein